MLVTKKDANMEAGGIVRGFWLIDEIMEDGKAYNWNTGKWETVESKTSQRYFTDNLQGLGSGDTVNLYINSMGGSVKEALGIYNVLQRCPATVVAYIDGYAASAASVIAMAAEKIIMPRNTAMMIHNAAWWAYGNPTELRKSADDLEVINKAAIESYRMHAGEKLPQDELQKMLDAETWLTAEDCIAYGLADEYGEQDVDLETALAQFTAAAKAAGPDARMFRQAPAFIAARYTPEVTPPMNHAEQGNVPENHSSLYMLLKSMTN